ncbi:MAG: metal-dependent hydrolase, partial [Saprospiraceae bacterium]|nr:metal-dependent hydrolase [Saprospiraceae bacterium]
SNGYYNIVSREDGNLQFNDLRFGSLSFLEQADRPPEYVFGFILKEEEGVLEAYPSRDEPEMDGAFERLWERMMGR